MRLCTSAVMNTVFPDFDSPVTPSRSVGSAKLLAKSLMPSRAIRVSSMIDWNIADLPPGPHRWGQAKRMARRGLRSVKSLRCEKELELAGYLRLGRKFRPVFC